VEESDPELGLEPPDRDGQCRLRDVKLRGSASEVAVFGNGQRVLELAEIHSS
jgi:hypothetical protein